MWSEEMARIDIHALARLVAVEALLADEEHWCKGALRDGQGRYCLLGALDAAGARHMLAPIFLRAAREVGGRRYWRIESFNDSRRTTHADILRVLQRARELIAAAKLPLAEAEPRSRRCGGTLCALYARSRAAVERHLAPARGRLAAAPQPVPVAVGR